jgi:cytochrome c556
MMIKLPVILLACVALASCSSNEDTHQGQPVTKRKAVFKEMLRSFEPMGLMVRERNPYNAAEFLKYAEALQTLSSQPWHYFTADSNYAPTRAKPDVWDKPVEFKQAQQRFMDATTTLVSTAKTGDFSKVQHDFAAVEDSCKSCHQQFRGIPR